MSIVFLKLEATLDSLKDPIKLDLYVVKSIQEPPENIEIVMETTNIFNKGRPTVDLQDSTKMN